MNKDCHLKRRVTLFAIVFNTIMIGSVHAAVLYSFENSLDGWSNVDTSTTANGPKQFASYSKAYFTANYNNAGVARLTPSDGDYLLVCDPFGTSASTIRDNAHETLVIRSPEFYLHTSGSISADIYGGAGSGSLVESYGALPANAIEGGYMGLALRDVETGSYVIEFHKTSSSDNYLSVGLTSEQVTPYVSDTKKYTLDFIDYRYNSWGWVGIDKVYIESGTSTSLVPEPSSTAFVTFGLIVSLAFRKRRGVKPTA